jgi:hypothetical protein
MTENLTIVQYARRFGVSDMTVRRRIKTGKLHAVLHEGRYFIPVEGGAPAKGPATPSGWGARPTASMPEDGGFAWRRPEARHEPRHVEGRHLGPSQSPPLTPMQHVASVAAQVMEGATTPDSYGGLESGEGLLPQSLRRPFAAQETSLVDTRALLAFCEASLKKLNETERRTVEKFKAKLEAVEATLARKDLEIKTLRQQVEDLQLLVKILERKKGA